MKAGTIILALVSVLAACGQQQAASDVAEANVSTGSGTATVTGTDGEIAIAAAQATGLPGKPQAVGFLVANAAGVTVDLLATVSPGTPHLKINVWTKSDRSDTAIVLLDLQDPCFENSAGWSCSYANADKSRAVTIHYSTAVQSYKAALVVWDGVTTQESDIFPMPNVNNSSSGCDPDDVVSCLGS